MNQIEADPFHCNHSNKEEIPFVYDADTLVEALIRIFIVKIQLIR